MELDKTIDSVVLNTIKKFAEIKKNQRNDYPYKTNPDTFAQHFIETAVKEEKAREYYWNVYVVAKGEIVDEDFNVY